MSAANETVEDVREYTGMFGVAFEALTGMVGVEVRATSIDDRSSGKSGWTHVVEATLRAAEVVRYENESARVILRFDDAVITIADYKVGCVSVTELGGKTQAVVFNDTSLQKVTVTPIRKTTA